MAHHWIGRAALVLTLAACGGSPDDGDGGEDGKADDAPRVEDTAPMAAGGADAEVCRAEGSPRPLPDDVHEASGAAPSRRNAGVFWTHNDSGEPEVFAIDGSGALAGRVRIAGARVEDWEDVAVAPCAGGDCLYIADIGDNRAARANVTVYRVPEPAPGDPQSRPAEAIRLTYPDGPHDAEAMFVLDGAIHIVTKGETGPIALYRAPAGASPGQPARLERVRELAAAGGKRKDRITGASGSPDGRWIAVRTLNNLSIYPAREFVGLGGGTPRGMDLKPLGEAQGEGVGFSSGGAVILTSEGGKKSDPATFTRLSCALE